MTADPSDSSVLRVVRRVRRRAADPLVVVLLLLGAVCAVVGSLWIYTVYRVKVDVELLRNALEAHVADRQRTDAKWRAEFDTIYRTLYSPPTPTEPTRKPSAVETWQVNRDKELRARIQRLEEWRLQQPR